MEKDEEKKCTKKKCLLNKMKKGTTSAEINEIKNERTNDRI